MNDTPSRKPPRGRPSHDRDREFTVTEAQRRHDGELLHRLIVLGAQETLRVCWQLKKAGLKFLAGALGTAAVGWCVTHLAPYWGRLFK